MHLLKLCIIAITLLGCTDEPGARSLLQKSGYTDVTITGHAPFSCWEHETFATGFKAKNGRGETVTGTVCCGLGCRIRTDWL